MLVRVTLERPSFVTVKGEQDNASMVFPGSYTFEGMSSAFGPAIPIPFPQRYRFSVTRSILTLGVSRRDIVGP
jgi:hypothetical protein